MDSSVGLDRNRDETWRNKLYILPQHFCKKCIISVNISVRFAVRRGSNSIVQICQSVGEGLRGPVPVRKLLAAARASGRRQTATTLHILLIIAVEHHSAAE